MSQLSRTGRRRYPTIGHTAKAAGADQVTFRLEAVRTQVARGVRVGSSCHYVWEVRRGT